MKTATFFRSLGLATVALLATGCAPPESSELAPPPSGAGSIPVLASDAPDLAALQAAQPVRFGVPPGEVAVPPVLRRYSEAEFASHLPAMEAYQRSSRAVLDAAMDPETWDAAAASIDRALADAEPQAPQYLLEQAAAVALLMRGDLQAAPASERRHEVARRMLGFLVENRSGNTDAAAAYLDLLTGHVPDGELRRLARAAADADDHYRAEAASIAAWATEACEDCPEAAQAREVAEVPGEIETARRALDRRLVDAAP